MVNKNFLILLKSMYFSFLAQALIKNSTEVYPQMPKCSKTDFITIIKVRFILFKVSS